MSEGFVERLRQLIGKSSARSFAQKAGLSDSTLRSILSGSKPTLDVLISIAAAGNVSIDWLATGKGGPNAKIIDMDEEVTCRVPIYSVEASAGNGALNAFEHVHSYMDIPAAYIRDRLGVSSKKIEGIFVVGDSMEPTLVEGDIAFVDRSAIAQSGRAEGVYVFRFNDQLYIKRLQHQGPKLVVKSDNAAYDPWEIEEKLLPDLVILGKIVGSFRRT